MQPALYLGTHKTVMYKFTTDQFGFTDSSFHVLRSNYPVSKHELAEVDTITITRGKQVGNWVLLLVLGLVLVAAGISAYTGQIVSTAKWLGNGGTIWVGRYLIVPMFLIFAGGACVLYSFKKGWVMTVSVKGKRHRFPLERLLKAKRLDQLVWFLSTNSHTQQVFDGREWQAMGR
jgi:hypothetical protein